ncbi:hypothetical protein SETIT_9G293400v2 [Setaria italica]|uniref:Uncharacterized protein n=1 Tax=Setaria italica TaxID=4555 RepID=A0A368SLX5_SETIT|nr:hypothetical protein SETIT_9G293400v2 [Setaria italica]
MASRSSAELKRNTSEAITCFVLLASLIAGQLLPMAVAEDGQKKLAVSQTTSSPVGLPKDLKMLIHFCFSCYLHNCPTRACRENCFCP